MEYFKPYLMSKEEWEKAVENCKPCYSQSKLTKNSMNEMKNKFKKLEYLYFDVKKEVQNKLLLISEGKLFMSQDEADKLIEELETPIKYEDIINKAKKLNLL